MKSFLRKVLPWWLLIPAKIILSRLPVSYTFWKRLHLFEHGDMNDPERSLQVFLDHATTAKVLNLDLDTPSFHSQADEFTVLELGPGDSLFSAVIAKSLGASKTWLIDNGPYATFNPTEYVALGKLLLKLGFDPVTFPMTSCIEEVFVVLT